jgi:precorrin-6B methylase 2
MFVLSSQQLLQLGCPSRGTLLDIGAGAGDVTCQLAPLFDQADGILMGKDWGLK